MLTYSVVCWRLRTESAAARAQLARESRTRFCVLLRHQVPVKPRDSAWGEGGIQMKRRFLGTFTPKALKELGEALKVPKNLGKELR